MGKLKRWTVRDTMAGEITESVKGGIGCLGMIAIIYVIVVIGYFVLNIILYLIPVVFAIVIGLAVLYGICYVVYALLTGR